MSKNNKGRGEEAVTAAEATLDRLRKDGHINEDG
jgi:hypothetical protein